MYPPSGLIPLIPLDCWSDVWCFHIICFQIRDVEDEESSSKVLNRRRLGELCIFAVELGASTRFPSSLGSIWFPAKSAQADSKLWRANHNKVIQLYLGRYTCFIATLTGNESSIYTSRIWKQMIWKHHTSDQQSKEIKGIKPLGGYTRQLHKLLEEGATKSTRNEQEIFNFVYLVLWRSRVIL